MFHFQRISRSFHSVSRAFFTNTRLVSLSSNNSTPLTDPTELKQLEESLLTFWFEESTFEQKFKKDPAFDQTIRTRFGDANRMARAHQLDAMRSTAHGSLAYIILLDQFNRNLFRNSADAYSSDSYCVELTHNAIANEFDVQLHLEEQHAVAKVTFLLIPLMHSETLANQDLLLEKYRQFNMDDTWARMHRDDIVKFGRFPTRNVVLGRKSTSEELAHLASPDRPKY